MMAENRRETDIVNYLKTTCHLSEETLFGKLKAANDDVNDRVTRVWSLPEPSVESDLDSSLFSEDEEESADSEESAEDPVEGEVSGTVMKGQLLRNMQRRMISAAMDDYYDEDVAEELESLTMDTPPEGAVSEQKANQLLRKESRMISAAMDDYYDEDVAKELESLTMDTPPKGAVSKQKADQHDDAIVSSSIEECEEKKSAECVTKDLFQGRDALTKDDAEGMTEMAPKRKNKPIDILWQRDKERKQSVFMKKFVHDGKEYTVTTEALRGGEGFLLSDRLTVRDLSEPRELLSASEMAKMENLLHNQCIFGELDTVSHLIEAKGVNPSALDEVGLDKIIITSRAERLQEEKRACVYLQ